MHFVLQQPTEGLHGELRMDVKELIDASVPPQSAWLTLSQATHIPPGRPSTNCLWRWCRRGVKSRSGERVRLQHVRAGGKVFTTADWVKTFLAQLAAADTSHFIDKAKAAAEMKMTATSPYVSPRKRQRQRIDPNVLNRHADHQIEDELDAEGL